MLDIVVLSPLFNSLPNLVKIGKWTQPNVMGNNCISQFPENLISVSLCELKAYILILPPSLDLGDDDLLSIVYHLFAWVASILRYIHQLTQNYLLVTKHIECILIKFNIPKCLKSRPSLLKS